MSNEKITLKLEHFTPGQREELLEIFSGKNAATISVPAWNNLPARPITPEEMTECIETLTDIVEKLLPLSKRVLELERRMDLLPWSKTKNESEQ